MKLKLCALIFVVSLCLYPSLIWNVDAGGNNSTLNEGMTLHEAARAGDLKAVKRLLKSGKPVDERDSWGETALMAATAYGRTEVVKCLIDANADVTAITNEGKKIINFINTENADPQLLLALRSAGAFAYIIQFDNTPF